MKLRQSRGIKIKIKNIFQPKGTILNASITNMFINNRSKDASNDFLNIFKLLLVESLQNGIFPYSFSIFL